MTKEIYLIRHAKSSWKDAGELADINRPLAVKGVRHALKMSKKLFEKNIKFDRIIASNGIRALHTAVIFANTMKQSPNKIEINAELYLPSSSNILDVIQKAGDQHRVIALFTHDMGISDFAFNTEAKLQHVATTGIVHYKLSQQKWADARMSNLEFQSYDFPKNKLS